MWQYVAPLSVEMRKEGLMPDVISFSAATSAHEKGGRWHKSQELVITMSAKFRHASHIRFDAIALANTVWDFATAGHATL
eukprot:4599044-Karenia_brevis.AAC.1